MYRILLFAIIHYTRVQSHKNSIWLYLQFNCLLSKCLGLSQTIFMTGTLYCTYSLLTSLLFAAIRYISFSLYSSFSIFDVHNVALTHYVSVMKRAPIPFSLHSSIVQFRYQRAFCFHPSHPSPLSPYCAKRRFCAHFAHKSRAFCFRLNSIPPIVSIVVVVSVASRAWE